MSIPPNRPEPSRNTRPPGEGSSTPSSDNNISEISSAHLNQPHNTTPHLLTGRVTPAQGLRADATLEEIETYLTTWAGAGAETENRMEAKQRIMNFLQDSTLQKLSLPRLGLISVPTIFHCNLVALRLIKLDLSQNQLIVIPPEIGDLHILQRLNLYDNQITVIPPEIGLLTSLKSLNLRDNSIMEIPPEIGQLTSLERLSLAYTSIRIIPPEIGQLTSLKKLDLFGAEITEIPPEISRLASLEELILRNNPTLTSLPNEILLLPASCEVDLSGCGLNATVLEHLNQAISAAGYNGPRIHYSILETPQIGSPRTTEEFLQELYRIIEQPYNSLGGLKGPDVNQRALHAWLSRLSYMSDYKDPAKKSAFATNIIRYLELANGKPVFRAQFAAIIHDAAETCGDRVTLSILHLGIASQLATIDTRDMKRLAEFLKRGILAIKLLEECARQKVLTLRFVDEIEVYLGYPIALKERLQLPIDVESMLYFRCSHLNDQDLTHAEKSVNDHINNQEKFVNFLIQQDKWLEALQAKYPPAYAALTRMRDTASEQANPNYVKIDADYKTGLMDLTKKALA